MKLNPLGYLDIPKDWPAVGFTDDGREVSIKEAWQSGSCFLVSGLAVDVPGKGRTHPWSNLEWLGEFQFPEDAEGDGFLTREELESNGVVDATLEGWARDKHGLVLDLSEDDSDTRAIRWDAWQRYTAETEW